MIIDTVATEQELLVYLLKGKPVTVLLDAMAQSCKLTASEMDDSNHHPGSIVLKQAWLWAAEKIEQCRDDIIQYDKEITQ